MPEGLPVLDLCVLVAYVAGVVGLGCAMMRKSGSTDEFMAAGRSLPGWAVGLSIFGTYVSSISFLANPGKSYASNWNPFVFSLSLPLAAWIATRYFVPFFRSSGEVSAYTHLEHRFGAWARTYAVICFLLMQLARVATILYLVALALAPMLGWSIPMIIVVTGVLVTLYTLMGGIEAVIWTDALQSVVLTLGMGAAVGVVMWQMPGGPTQVFEIAVRDHKFSLGSFGASLTESTFWVVLLYGLFINLQNFAVDQTYVQRYVTAKSDAAANQSVWMGALLYLVVSALLFLVGTSLYAFYQVQPGLLTDASGGTIAADAVFPHFIASGLPAGLSGLLIAAVLAAAMSSVDSSLNSAATLFLCDIYKRYLRPDAGERESMRVLYATTLVCGVGGTGAGLWMMNAEQVLDVWWQLAGVAGGGLLGLFLLGRMSPRVRGPHAAAAVVVGVLVILWMTFSPMKLWPAELADIKSPLHGFLTIVFGTTSILIVGAVSALIWPGTPGPLHQPEPSPR
ncbi:Sodium/glucose cotransporter [Pirellulimonas nuda]|uniref:Sodium/glucose cotransporter n=1 Tax=Pirellulimonas nuda TaxID=2528009 RepID=A0A518DHR5_9BACT|nr:sodium:solute symporter [Pirellulimonas nuda]QDU90942.1 Sodium/glucose cotransporter [Pirellulimonas nuda]